MADLRTEIADPQIVILNGAGSVGKSSAARALQAITAAPFLHLSMDAFLDMLPERALGHPDGMVFERIDEADGPSVAIRSGPLVDRALRGMRRAVQAMAAQGNNLIVDDVMLENEGQDYRRLLSSFSIRFVGLFAPLDVLEERERRRGDREVWLARWQFERVHRGRAYDLDIDASGDTPEAIAERIRAAFNL
jgi:chloramphenicol 3-O phosphotransferase